MEAANTHSNRALAQAVNSRITADAVMLGAKSTLWRLTGVGAMCALIGLGIGAAFFGYSYVHDPRTSVDKMAGAFIEALEKSTLKMTGEVKLDTDATVKLDPNGAQVKVDPTSTVRLNASDAVVRLDSRMWLLAKARSQPAGRFRPMRKPRRPRSTVIIRKWSRMVSV
jgi:hypothetical protein